MNISELLHTEFQLEAIQIEPLEGYGSTNYKVDTHKGPYVLKRYADDPQRRRLLQVESKVLSALQKVTDYDFPLEIDTVYVNGKEPSEASIWRLHHYVEGEFLAEVTQTNSLLNSLGQFLGDLDLAMATVDPFELGFREINWDLRHFLKNRELLAYIPQEDKRSLVDYFFLQYEEQVLPFAHKLRTSLIHNDANDWNVLTQKGEVSGIIDFGDMCYSWLINELAIAIPYIMMGKENPIAAAVRVITAYHSVNPLEEVEMDLLYYLVAARLCTSVCNSAYNKTQLPDSAYITISEEASWSLLRKWLTINPIYAANQFRKAAGYPLKVFPSIEKQMSRRYEVFSKSLSLSYEEPIQMYRSAFQYMYDTQGNTYLDAYNNIMLAGHCHPHVVRTGQKTMARLNTNTRYLYEEALSYSESLLKNFPEKLNRVFLVNSGSAASDLALRLARYHTQKESVAVLEQGYHGNTQLGIQISHYKFAAEGGMGKDNQIISLPLPNVYQSGLEDNGTAGAHFGKEAIEILQSYRGQIAAFVAEPIVGCGGQVPLPKGYLQHVYPAIQQQGGLCISDETQVGFGRLGTHFWGFEMQEVIPDLVILGKPMGNGHPIGAVVTTEAIAGSFEQGPEFFSSFGGNPVSCAIGEAVLEVIQREGLQGHALKVGDHLKKGLLQLKDRYPVIADIRGSGLFLGVELIEANGSPGTQLAKHVKNELRRRHILISTDGPYEQVLKIKPPLSFNCEDAEKLCTTLASVLEASNIPLPKN